MDFLKYILLLNIFQKKTTNLLHLKENKTNSQQV